MNTNFDIPDETTVHVDQHSAEIQEELAHLAELKTTYRQLEEDAKSAKEEHDRFQADLFDKMRDRQLLTIKTDSGTYSCKSTIYANVNDMPAFIVWAQENGLYDEFLKEAPEKRRLNELVRDRIDSGDDLPPGVNWYAREYISISQN